ncbi:MAG: helix-turn-helix domain-containing protein [Myxococcota bacterium]
MSVPRKPQRRSQAERRARTRGAVLESATRLFGEKGYEATSLEDIAADCGTTIRPIYHYFGGKRQLFAAVNEALEERILSGQQASVAKGGASGGVAAWRSFLELCRDAAFRQIALVDAPHVLGRTHWAKGPVTRATLERLRGGQLGDEARGRLVARVLVAALGEAALVIAESDDPEAMSRVADEIGARAIPALFEATASTPETS